jgi:hypothetical protein
MARYATLFVLLWFFGLSAFASAEPLRIDLGLGGVFPAGQWTRCTVSGLEDVKDGTLIVVHVGEVFDREFTVAARKAEGMILLPDESPAITIEVPGKGRVALPNEAGKQLRGVKDKLPVIFLGADNLPEEREVREALAAGEIFPIRMTTDEFFRFALPDVEWVRVFVLGRSSEEDLGRLRDRFSHLSGSVLLAKPDAVAGWLQKLSFEKVGELMVYNRRLAEVLPVPRGSVRPELYEIFGPPSWPNSVRRSITLGFVASLALFALSMVLPARSRKIRVGGLLLAAALAAVFAFFTYDRISAPPESVSLLEVPEGAEKGVETTLISQAVLTPAGRGLSFSSLDIPLSELNPVASFPTQWIEHKLRLNRMNGLDRDLPAPSREVFVRFSYGPVPPTADDFLETDGERVWVYKKIPPPPAGPTDSPPFDVTADSLAAYIAGRQHKDSRVDELRHGMLTFWNRNLRRPGLYAIHWTEPATDAKVFSAGTLVVVKVKKPLAEQWEHGVFGLFTEPPGAVFSRCNS